MSFEIETDRESDAGYYLIKVDALLENALVASMSWELVIVSDKTYSVSSNLPPIISTEGTPL